MPNKLKKRDWLEISDNARFTMQLMGEFTPTMFPKERCVFSRRHNRIFHASYLRKMAEHLNEVADWLDRTAWQYDEPFNLKALLKHMNVLGWLNNHARNKSTVKKFS